MVVVIPRLMGLPFENAFTRKNLLLVRRLFFASELSLQAWSFAALNHHHMLLSMSTSSIYSKAMNFNQYTSHSGLHKLMNSSVNSPVDCKQVTFDSSAFFTLKQKV